MAEKAFIVRLRGLPFTANEEDIMKFFQECNIKNGKDGVHITHGRDGRVTGEAYVEFQTEEDYNMALRLNNQNMGRRYIEVFESDEKELSWVTGRQVPSNNEYVVRLRGLPYDVDRNEIAKFFEGIRIANNGIALLLDKTGRSTGEAYVQFMEADSAERAKARHMEKMGHRYIEIFKSNMTEANNAIKKQMDINSATNRGGSYYEDNMYPGDFNMDRGGRPGGPGSGYGPPGRPFSSGGFNNRPGPYNRPAGGGPGPMRGRGNVKGFGPKSGKPIGCDYSSSTGHSVHLRGLPFIATEEDILDFFAPIQPVNVKIEMNEAGRPTGEADVDFASHEEAKEAMRKDHERIGSRYIELFLNSKPAHLRGVRSLMEEDFTEFQTPPIEGGFVNRRIDGPMGDEPYGDYGNSRYGGFSNY